MAKFNSAWALFAAVLCMAGMTPVESRECNFRSNDVLVIGGNSPQRVMPYAKKCNFCYFVPKEFDAASIAFEKYCESKYRYYMEMNVKKEEREGFIDNCVWINEAMNADHTIVDIGPDPDPNRRPGPFYSMEKREILDRNIYFHLQQNTECAPFVPK